MTQLHTGFILTRNWRDTDRGIELELWLSTEAGPHCLQVPAREAVFFLPRQEIGRAQELLADKFTFRAVELELRDFQQQTVTGLYFRSQRQLRQARDLLQEADLDPLEADINPVERYLMERFVEALPQYQHQSQPRLLFQPRRSVYPARLP